MSEEELRAWAEDHRPEVRTAILDLFRRLDAAEAQVNRTCRTCDALVDDPDNALCGICA